LLGAVDEALHSTGRPLDNGTRAYFEPRFGHSFSRVQVHSGSAVHDDAAAAANAKAFTVGSHLVFAAHEYAPHTRSGKGLIAHELAHVVQQAGGALPSVQRQVYKPDDLKPRHRDPPKPAKRKKVHRPKPFDPLRGCKAEDLRTPEAGSCIAKNSGSPADITFFVRCLPSGEKECCELRDDPADPITICEDLSEHTESSPHRRKGRGKRSGS